MIENDKQVITDFQELKSTQIDQFLQCSQNDINPNDKSPVNAKNPNKYLASILQAQMESNRSPYYCHPKYRKNYCNISQLTNKKKLIKVQEQNNGQQQFQWIKKLEQVRQGTYNIGNLFKKNDNSIIFKSSGLSTKQEMIKKRGSNKIENSDVEKKNRYENEDSGQMINQESEVQLPQLNLCQRTTSKQQSIKQMKSQIISLSQKPFSQTYTTSFYSTKVTNQQSQKTHRNYVQQKILPNSKTCSKSLATTKKNINRRQSNQSNNNHHQNSLHKKDIVRRTQNKVVSAFNVDSIIKEHRANNLKDIEKKLRSNLTRNTQYHSNKLPSSQTKNAVSPLLKKQSSGKQIRNYDFNPNILVRQFNKKCGYAINTKVFVFNSQDNYIKNILMKWGWIENPVIQSPFYNLKWTYLPTAHDFNCTVRADEDQYSIVQKQNKRTTGNNQQFYNHFSTTHQLTSKAFLSKNLKQNQNIIGNIDTYFPLCFDLGNAVQSNTFSKVYREIYLLGLLQNYYEHLLTHCNGLVKQWQQHYFNKYMIPLRSEIQNNSRQFSKCVFLKSQFKSIHFQNYKHHNSNFLINMPISIHLLKYWRNLRKKRQEQYEINLQSKADKVSKQHFLQFTQSAFQIQFDNIQIASENKYLFKYSDGTTNLQGFKKQLYATPSEIFIRQLIKEYVFHSVYNLYQNGELQTNFDSTQLLPLNPCFGIMNLWIVKPSGNARGSGIRIYNKYKDIIEKSKAIQSRIVQKYIQKPLIIKNPKYTQIFNKKFDIRQWVLVKSIDPLQIYMFSKCYIRICSQEYICQDFGNLKRHLTNYSLNKEKFIEDKQQSQSIISSDQFAEILQAEFKISWREHIQPQIQKIITKSIIACQQSLYGDLNGQNQMACFEMYGYDILLDEKFNAWLLEVNLSPACQQRTPWIKQWLNQMGTSLLKIVLPSSLLPQGNQNQNILFKDDSIQWAPLDINQFQKDLDWQLLVYKDYKFQKPTHTDLGLQIIGQKINTVRILKQTKAYMQKLSISKISQYLSSFPYVVNHYQYQKKQSIGALQKYLKTITTVEQYTKRQRQQGIATIKKYFATLQVRPKYNILTKNYQIRKIQHYFGIARENIQFQKIKYQWFIKDIAVIHSRQQMMRCLQKIGQGKKKIDTIQYYFKRKLFQKQYQSKQILYYIKSVQQYKKYLKIDLPQYNRQVHIKTIQIYFHGNLQAAHTKDYLRISNTKTIERYLRIAPQMHSARLKRIIQFESNVSRIWRVLKRKCRKQSFLLLKNTWKDNQKKKNIQVIQKHMRNFIRNRISMKQQMRKIVQKYKQTKNDKKNVF